MAFTQAQLDALDAAIADSRGAKSITFEDQSVQLNDADALMRLRAQMVADVSTTRQRYRLASVSKGV